MTDVVQDVRSALVELSSLLNADGYGLDVVGADAERVTLQISAGDGACAECLVPPGMMELYVRDALAAVPGCGEARIELRYPPHGG